MYIDQKDIFEKTNGGLDIILQLFPEAEKALHSSTKKFKLRPEEKTASAAIKQLEDGAYVVTDFGGDQKPRNAIALYMQAHNLEYRQAISQIASSLGLSAEKNPESLKPAYEKRKPAEGEELGSFHYTPRAATEPELKVWGPLVTEDLLTRYNIWAVEEYRYIRADKQTGETVAHCFASTENYPIFMIEVGEWRKRYEPKNPDKSARFRHDGQREKDFIFGLSQCQKAYDKLNEARDEDDHKEQKLPEIIICSGDRDAINCASMGYNVVWLNSETATLTHKQFNKLASLAEKVYNVPDLDETGHRAGNELALAHLDVHTIRLPKALKKRKDWRGNPCKDLRDYMKYYTKWDFKKLVETALPFRLWDQWWDDKKKQIAYRLNHANVYNFLQNMGFYRLEVPNEKSGYIYIKIDGNIVREVLPVQIKSYILQFLKKRQMHPALMNTFFRAQNQLSDASLSNLDTIELDFINYERHAQYFFFKNATWEITKRGAKVLLPGSSTKYVWDDAETLQHTVEAAQTPPFEVQFDEKNQEYSLKVNDDSCLFFQFLRNTSRVHWRKELEEKQPLSDLEKQEEELHLINKIYALGYLLHGYKNPGRPWMVYGMDNKISETGESHGGSGKSITLGAPRRFLKTVVLPGRNPKLTENPHVYDNVTEHTDYILIDDANQYLKLDFFFTDLTGDMVVNPKHGKQYEIPFERSPKFCVSTNFTPRDLDPSLARRILYCVFSDYYHFNKDDEYNETRTPDMDFGKNLFKDFTEEEWTAFFNTMAACLTTYLRYPKIDPPMQNVELRNLRSIMTEPFKEWADLYFSKEGRKTDCLHKKHEAFEHFCDTTRNRAWKINRWTKSLNAWIKYYGFTLNPAQLCNNGKRIIHRDGDSTPEYIYIQAYKEELNDNLSNTTKIPTNYDESDPYK